VLGAKQVYCASPTTQATADDSAGVKDTGGKGDEADVEQLKVGADVERIIVSCKTTFVIYDDNTSTVSETLCEELPQLSG